MIHPARLDPDVLAADCAFRTTRRSGPGGQNRNKVETAVVLTHGPSGIIAEASERRTQGENRREALFRLRLKLAVEVRTQPERLPGGAYQPSALWVSRCRGSRITVSPEHDDFPALLAEALDILTDDGNEPRRAAAELACTPSQLIRLLKQEPRALIMINQSRQRAGLHLIQ